jgi:peroxiredoxin Q/BCP
VKVFGVSFDSPAENAAFAAKHGFPYPLLCDESRALGLAFRACASASDPYPNRITYVIDPDGVIEQATLTKDAGGQAAAIAAALP